MHDKAENCWQKGIFSSINMAPLFNTYWF